MIGQFPIASNYCGLILPNAFHLLAFAFKAKIQIDQVNSSSPEWLDIIRFINCCCGVIDELGGRIKTTIFEQVMRVMLVKLNITFTPPVEEQWLCWTTYANLLMWFVNFRNFFG
jgi:hypothetical protein